MNNQIRVLIIEDHADIAENISDCLTAEGFITDFAMDGIGGMHLALTNPYDVIILDLMLPGMDGITLCKKLRSQTLSQNRSQPPVLMLTARDTLAEKLEGFDAGADDYLVKPFEMDELIARVKALSKRMPQPAATMLQVEDLVVDIGQGVVHRKGKQIDLNPSCFKLLVFLMKHHPNIVSRSELEFHLWGDMPPGSDALKSHIYLLRKKVDKHFSFRMIQTVHGFGYRIGEANAQE